MNLPNIKISIPYAVAILLIINAVFFTTQSNSIIIQLVISMVIFLYQLENDKIKKKLYNSQKQLTEDAKIFDKNIIVSETGLDGKITYVNQKFCDATGYSREELIGYTHKIIRDPDTPTLFYQKLWETITNGDIFQETFKNIKKDGTAFWMHSTISPIFTNGNISSYKAIRFDISERITAQKSILLKDAKLKEQSTRFEFAINSSRDGFWDYNITSKEFYLSSAWKKRLGFEKDENLTYLKYLSLMPEQYRFEHHIAMHDMLDECKSGSKFVHFKIRYPLITKSGEKLIIEDVGNTFFDSCKSPTRITGFHRDITDQERQSKIIESQNRVAAMGEMIGNIAHQWRQPIGAINNILNDLEIDIELDNLAQVDTQKILNTSNKIKEYTCHLSQTIDDFKELYSNEKRKTSFILTQLIKEALSIVEPEYKRNNIKIQLTKSHDTCNEYTGYERELLQVILNILNNAKDILIEKSIENPKVLITLTQENNNSIIIIQDNAGGIPEAIINKIFNPYFTTKHESLGIGIGLYMSKKIVMQYLQGSLEAVNESSGAKFIIKIPKEV